jgi:hypothetical protein
MVGLLRILHSPKFDIRCILKLNIFLEHQISHNQSVGIGDAKKRKFIHDSDYESASEDKSSASPQQDCDDNLDSDGPPTKKLRKFEELLLKFVINTDQPLSLVDSDDFRALLKYLNKHVDIPCRQTFTNFVDHFYNKIKNEILFQLSKVEYVRPIVFH